MPQACGAHARVTLGGKAITSELAAELGFDRGFDEHTRIEDVVAFSKGRQLRVRSDCRVRRQKPDITAGYSYAVHDARIAACAR